jgi:hypothetical protein
MIPGARDGHSACIINHSMFVFGGFEEEIDRFSQDVHALDFRTMHWSYIITQVRLHTSRGRSSIRPLRAVSHLGYKFKFIVV